MIEKNSYQPPLIFGIHAKPGPKLRLLLIALPFVILLISYFTASHFRHQENPRDKLLPTMSQMVDAVERMAFHEDARTGRYLMAEDTLSSLRRLFAGVLLAAIAGLFTGVVLGLFPGFSIMLNPFLTFIAMIPPLAILPILFIAAGIGEAAKITLIFIGIFPIIARDTRLAVLKLPGEQITKALTLGASQLQIAWRITLPQVLPRLLDTIRLSLGAAWLFLIAAEAIAADSGLGYRIFLVRRYLAMDVIIPYVLWITLLGFLMDLGLRHVVKFAFPWYQGARE